MQNNKINTKTGISYALFPKITITNNYGNSNRIIKSYLVIPDITPGASVSTSSLKDNRQGVEHWAEQYAKTKSRSITKKGSRDLTYHTINLGLSITILRKQDARRITLLTGVSKSKTPCCIFRKADRADRR